MGTQKSYIVSLLLFDNIGDRTSKQKLKLNVTEEKLLNLMLKYNGGKPRAEIPGRESDSDPEDLEHAEKLHQVKAVIEEVRTEREHKVRADHVLMSSQGAGRSPKCPRSISCDHNQMQIIKCKKINTWGDLTIEEILQSRFRNRTDQTIEHVFIIWIGINIRILIWKRILDMQLTWEYFDRNDITVAI
ncbi:hypothetical protein YC2023_044661 [Brassica napus]